MRIRRRADVRDWAVALSLALVALATLWPQGAGNGEATRELFCFPCGRRGVADAFANLLLFIPLGAALRWRFRSTPRALLLGVLASVAIEGAQYLGVVPGRVVSVADIVSNGAGVATGAMVARHWWTLAAPAAAAAASLAVASSLALVLAMAASAWALHRPPGGAPATAPTRSSLPYATGYGWFEQVVTGVVFDGAAFDSRGNGPMIIMAAPDSVHHLSLLVRGRDRRPGMVPMLFVHEARDSTAHLLVAQRGGQLALRAQLNADRLGLRMPEVVVNDIVFPGDTVGSDDGEAATRTVRASLTGSRWTIGVAANGDSADSRHSASLRIAPLLGWMLLVPMNRSNGWQAVAGTVIVLLFALVPTCFWIGVAGRLRRHAAAAAGVLLVAVALVGVPLASGLAPPGLVEWLAIAVAAAVGGRWAIRAPLPVARGETTD